MKLYQYSLLGNPGSLKASMEECLNSLCNEWPGEDIIEVDTTLEGSLSHKVRFALEQSGIYEATVCVHDIDQTGSSVVQTFELHAGVDDPSYVVQRSLYRYALNEGDDPDEEVTVETEADHVAYCVRTDIKELSMSEKMTAEDIVERYRAYEEAFGGPAIMPIDGTAEEIIESLPELARSQFIKLANELNLERPLEI